MQNMGRKNQVVLGDGSYDGRCERGFPVCFRPEACASPQLHRRRCRGFGIDNAIDTASDSIFIPKSKGAIVALIGSFDRRTIRSYLCFLARRTPGGTNLPAKGGALRGLPLQIMLLCRRFRPFLFFV